MPDELTYTEEMCGEMLDEISAIRDDISAIRALVRQAVDDLRAIARSFGVEVGPASQ